MGRPKHEALKFPMPSCYGCEDFVDNRGPGTYLSKAMGRHLYFGERYCLRLPRPKQFLKSIGENKVPAFCPRHHAHPLIRVYAKTEKSYSELFLGHVSERPGEECYTFAHQSQCGGTANQFYKQLISPKVDNMSLFGWEPEPFDVIELDNGLRSYYIQLTADYTYIGRSFHKEESDTGFIGGFQILPHDGFNLDRYAEGGPYFAQCLGYARGHFGGGPFRHIWVENAASEDGSTLDKDLDTLLLALQEDGFLKNLMSMQIYCLTRKWAALPSRGFSLRTSYGFHTISGGHIFYICCDPSEDSNHNVTIYAYKHIAPEAPKRRKR